MGDARTTLAAAVASLAALPGVRLRGVSRLYRTAPVGVVDQPDFLNAVVALDVPAGPDPVIGALALLVALKQLERAFGRRDRARWGPRELDLDLLVFGRVQLAVDRPEGGLSDDPGKADLPLVVPHPEARRRLFVLAPLADVARWLSPPGWGETVATARLRQERLEDVDSVIPIGNWSADRRAWV